MSDSGNVGKVEVEPWSQERIDAYGAIGSEPRYPAPEALTCRVGLHEWCQQSGFRRFEFCNRCGKEKGTK